MSIITDDLRRVSNKEVQGSGFSVRVPNVHEVWYERGETVATVEIEGGVDASGMVNWLIYKDTLKERDEPGLDRGLSANQREQILSDITKSLLVLGMPHRCV
jgi:hypothetical protein